MPLRLLAAALAMPAAATAAPCELHLFGRDVGAGPQPAGNLLAKPLPSSPDPLALSNAMSPQDRMAEVSDSEYRAALALPAEVPVIRHWDVPPPAKVQHSLLPLAAGAPGCHAELIGYTSMALMASRSAKHQNELNLGFVYREFGAGSAKPFQVRGWGYGAASTEKRVGRQAALESLRAASVEMVRDFGKKVVKKRAAAPGEEPKE